MPVLVRYYFFIYCKNNALLIWIEAYTEERKIFYNLHQDKVIVKSKKLMCNYKSE